MKESPSFCNFKGKLKEQAIKIDQLIFILGLSVCSGSCHSYKETLGTYQSMTTKPGLQTTTLRLHDDSTFEYVIKGSLIYDSSNGKYRILNHKLFLSEIWEKTGMYHWTLLEREPKTYIYGHDTVEYQSIFYFGEDKLFYGNFATGKKDKKASVHLELINH